jgi:hypothetical protein
MEYGWDHITVVLGYRAQLLGITYEELDWHRPVDILTAQYLSVSRCHDPASPPRQTSTVSRVSLLYTHRHREAGNFPTQYRRIFKMNEVQTVYHRFFETEQMFSESRDSIEVLRLSIDSSRRAKYQELELRVSDIPYAFDGEAKETGSLTLFRVGKNFADGVLSISREAFEFVFERCSIAPQLKYMITRDLPGFQSFLNDEHVPTFYFNEPPYTIVWSYDTKSLASRGLFIYRINDRFPQRGAIAYQDILKDHSTLCATPLLPLWVGITQSLLFVEATFHKERQEIREVEAVTLHSPWYRDNKGWGYIEDTATQSQRITASIVSCADVERHIRSLEVGLEFLHDSHHRAWFDALSPDQLLIVQDQERKIEAAADFVAARLNAIIHYLEYLQKRARAQLAVVSFVSYPHYTSQVTES